MVCILNPSLAPVKMHANERIGLFQPLGSQVPLPATAQVIVVVPTHQNTALRQMEQGIQGLTETEVKTSSPAEYADIISASEEDMGRTNVVRHMINTGDADPVRQPPHRVPFHQQSMVKQMPDDMLSKGVIEPASGPWSSPMPKKDGSICFCVDFRRLNSLTKKDAQPLPRIDDTLDALSGARSFFTLDLESGYWQVEVDPADKEKTAFVTPFGLHQFRIMPFGLCNAPGTFQ